MRLNRGGTWEETQEVTTTPGDIWRTSAASDGKGNAWVFWSQRKGLNWELWGRLWAKDSWKAPQRISNAGSNTFHRAASSKDGEVFVVWQSHQGAAGRSNSDIWLRAWNDGQWDAPVRVSESSANDWEPQVAGGPKDQAHIVWDSYDSGNYDVFYLHTGTGNLSRSNRLLPVPVFRPMPTWR